MSVVRIRESPYYRGFLKKIHEHFVGTLETVRNREVSVLGRRLYREVRLYLVSFVVTLIEFDKEFEVGHLQVVNLGC